MMLPQLLLSMMPLLQLLLAMMLPLLLLSMMPLLQLLLSMMLPRKPSDRC